MRAGDLVLLHLAHPSEKFWGVLFGVAPEGVTLRAISLASFEDWMRAAAGRREQLLGLSTMFFPMHRVERLFLDEQIGEVESFAQRFNREVGTSVQAYLALETGSEDATN